MSRVLPSCIFTLILQDAAAVPPVSVGIIVCNTHGNAFSCKLSCISGFRGISSVLGAGVRRSRRCGGRCLADGQGVAPLPLRLPPISAPVAVGPEHWPRGDSSPLLPPPIFFGGGGRPLVVAALLWCSPSPAVLLVALAPGSSLLGVIIYGSIFKCFQPRPELTHAHA